MAKQHIHQKVSRLPFLDLTHRTKGHTSHMAKQNKNFILVLLDWTHKTNGNQDIWPNNIFNKRVLGFLFQTGHTEQTDTQVIWPNQTFIQRILCLSFQTGQTGQTDTQDIWSNKIFMQRILCLSFQTGHTRQTAIKTYGQTTYSTKGFQASFFRLYKQDKHTHKS